MSSEFYNGIALFNVSLVLLGFVGALSSFAFVILRWNSPQRRGHIIRLILSLVVIGFAFAFQYFILFVVYLPALGREQLAQMEVAREKRFQETTHVLVGDTCPEFALPNITGESFVISETKGKVVLINFFATWCGPCLQELPHIEKIWEENKGDENFRMIVIGREETDESVMAFRDEHRFTFPMAADSQRSVYDLFAKESIPRTIVIAPDGKVVYSKMGFMESDLRELENVLVEQLAAAK